MTVAILSDRLLNVIEGLEPGETLETKLARLAEHEIRRRLACYQLTDRLFQQKYGMTLVEFEASDMVSKLSFSFQAESDHQDWDLAVDGIRTMQQQLSEVRAER